MRKFQRPLAVFFVSLIFFLVDFDLPSKVVFDEAHYLPAAHSIWNLEANGNYEHPPLAKELMGVGMWITGWDLNGARLTAIIFGALACVAFFLIAEILLEDSDWALLAVVLAWLNGMTFILARVAMLEIFLSAFLLWSAYFFLRALKTGEWRDHLFSALFMGAALSCKWYALMPWVYLTAGAVYLARGKRMSTLANYLFPPVAIYALSYIPLMMVEGPQYSPLAFLQMQSAMYSAQKMVIAMHSEYSMWWTWPLKFKPMWMMRDVTETAGKLDVQAVILQGNPMILWFGFGSVVFLLSEFGKHKIAYLAPLYMALLLPWIVIPRVNTFYYYYFPLAWIATLAAAELMQRLWDSEGTPARVFVRAWVMVAAVMFFYHWPLYTGWSLSMDAAQTWYPFLF